MKAKEERKRGKTFESRLSDDEDEKGGSSRQPRFEDDEEEKRVRRENTQSASGKSRTYDEKNKTDLGKLFIGFIVVSAGIILSFAVPFIGFIIGPVMLWWGVSNRHDKDVTMRAIAKTAIVGGVLIVLLMLMILFLIVWNMGSFRSGGNLPGY